MENSNNKLDIDYSKLTIEKMFQNMYIVPDYQREYVWEEEQIEQMMNDLTNAYFINPKKAYFMGMIVVYSNGTSNYELIDGQQRITTFFLLICAFIHIYKENNVSTSHLESRLNKESMDQDGLPINNYSLELQYTESTLVLDNIFNNKITESYIDSINDGSEKRLYSAYKTIRLSLKNNFYTDSGINLRDFQRFVFFIWYQVQVVQIESRDMSDALGIFETINQRGVGLNSLDLLKNMLFMQIERDEFKELNNNWKKMMDNLMSAEKKPLRFLRYFITSNYDITNPDTNTITGILPEDKIYEWFLKNNTQCHYKENPKQFMQLLDNNVKKYTEFVKPELGINKDDYLINISRIAGSSYRSHLVLLLAGNNMDKYTLSRFKQILETLIFYATLDGIKGNETEKLFANWAPLIKTIRDKNDLIKFTNQIIKPQVDKWNYDRNFKQKFLNLNTLTTQKYRIKYILARIAKYIDEFRSNGDNYSCIDNYWAKNIEIEHIMPQKCNYEEDYDLNDKKEFDEYVNKLGNLTLLAKTQNSSCKNLNYSEKRPHYQDSQIYLTSSISSLTSKGVNNAANKMDQKLKSWTIWNKQSIEERQLLLYTLAIEIWNFDNIMQSW